MRRTRTARTFDRVFMGQDGLRHIVQKDRVYAACGQSVASAKWWGGDKTLTCLTCIARSDDG